MICAPHWTAYVSALLVPLVAVFAVYIGARQWRTAQDKLKLELFDKRLSVYSAATGLLGTVAANGEVSNGDLHDFLVATREAKWLLDTRLAKYLQQEVYDRAVDLLYLAGDLNAMRVQPDAQRTENIRRRTELKKMLSAQHEVLDDMFSPFLRLQH